MLKKIINFVLVFTLTFSLFACGKYRIKYPDMPENLRVKLETQLEEGKESLASAEDETDKEKALLEIAFAYDQLGYLDKAIRYYNQILETNSNHYQSNNNLGVIYEVVEEFEKAALSYGKNLDNHPNDSEALRDSLRALLSAKHFDDAQNTLDNFAAINKDNEDEKINNLILIESQKIQNAKIKYENENTAN